MIKANGPWQALLLVAGCLLRLAALAHLLRVRRFLRVRHPARIPRAAENIGELFKSPL